MFIFIDERCPDCNGDGCEKCRGTGIVGHMEHSDKMIAGRHTEFGERIRQWRLGNRLTFFEMGLLVGVLPGQLSEIENGRRKPSEQQRRAIEDLIR